MYYMKKHGPSSNVASCFDTGRFVDGEYVYQVPASLWSHTLCRAASVSQMHVHACSCLTRCSYSCRYHISPLPLFLSNRDMQRYHTLLAGASWMAEYGDPDTDDWEFLKEFSPYHSKSWKVVSPTMQSTFSYLVTYGFGIPQTLTQMQITPQSLSQRAHATTVCIRGMLASLSR